MDSRYISSSIKRDDPSNNPSLGLAEGLQLGLSLGEALELFELLGLRDELGELDGERDGLILELGE